MKYQLYNVYHNGQLIITGTSAGVAKAFGKSSLDLRPYAEYGYRLFDKYDIHFVDENDIASNEETPLDYLINRLKDNDNTIFKGSPKQYVKELKKLGLEIKWEPSMYDKNYYIVKVIKRKKL